MLGVSSLRVRFLLIVLLGAVLPLAGAGFWLTRSAVRQSEQVLAARLLEATEDAAAEIRQGWIRRRSRLLSLGEDPALSRWPEVAPRELAAVEPWLLRGTVTEIGGDTVFRYPSAGAEGGAAEPFPVPVVVTLPVPEPGSGRSWRIMEAEIPISALLDETRLLSFSPGMVLGAFDPGTGASFLPLPFDPAVLEAERFQRGGEPWISARSEVRDPPVVLVAAAPLDPVVGPFRGAALRGLWILGVLTALVVGLVAFSTRRVTRSLDALTEAAEAISRGDLERSVPVAGDDEVGRLGRAFNAMTSNLRRTLAELSERDAMAAVGEFATSLSHDVRNALTSIRLDLQLLEEELPGGSRGRRLEVRALRKLERLNQKVTGSLALARSGRIRREPLDLTGPLHAAVEAARPEFESRGARLTCDPPPPEALVIQGDASTLEQTFFNLLLNAAQALGADGPAPAGESTREARVAVEERSGFAHVRVRDTGPGIPDELRDRVLEPFFSTREEGTGLGLAIARRGVRAHGGELLIRGRKEGGTEVEVRLPLA